MYQINEGYRNNLKNNSGKDQDVILILCLSDKQYYLSGNWESNFHSSAIYCSDVISFPENFEGIKMLIHPDDIEYLKDKLHHLSETDSLREIEFRTISTYGKIEYIKGRSIYIGNHTDFIVPPWVEHYENLINLKAQNDLLSHLQILSNVKQLSEKLEQCGTCYINPDTMRAWYSDVYYSIHGLQPQSLNNHIHTFDSFIHPEDKNIVLSSFEDAFKHRLPLHIEYRIIDFNKELKNVSLVTKWFINQYGHEFLFLFLKDDTDIKLQEKAINQIHDELWFHKQLILLDEATTNMGHWYINLLTRKSYFSDNYYRIFGVKNIPSHASFKFFTNYIHPDDRDRIEEAYEKMIKQHLKDDIEFRVINQNGKVKYLRQCFKILTLDAEIIIAGTLQDITNIKNNEKRIKSVTNILEFKDQLLRTYEEVNKTGTWVWNLELEHIDWQDGIYLLLGFKPQSVELNYNRFIKYVHPNDRVLFQNNVNLMQVEHKESTFSFRLVSKDGLKYIEANFKFFKEENTNIFIAIFTDQTVSVNLNEAATEKIRFNEQLYESIDDAIFITDLDNNINVWNSKSELLFKKAASDVINRNLFDIIPEYRNEKIIKSISSALNGITIRNQVFYSQNPNNLYNWELVPVFNNDGKVKSIIHYIKNVAEELVLQDSLHEQFGIIEKLLDLSGSRIIGLDKNLNYSIWNKLAEEYFNVKKEEVGGRNILDYFPFTNSQTKYEDFRKALKGEYITFKSFKENEGKREEIKIIPVKVKEKVVGILWVCTDIKESVDQ
jgi:PAS domain S-box-containing protein